MQLPMNLKPAEYQTVTWHVTVPAGQSVDDLLVPDYWRHVAFQLRPGHEVVVVPEDRAWHAHLMVRDVSKGEALMGVISKAEFKGKALPATGADEETETKWISPTIKFGIIRKKDGERLAEGFETKEAAALWLAERSKSMAA